MTIEQFEAKLKALLREAKESGLDTEEICATTEHVIAYGWNKED
jgi:hypothetical protein